MAKRESANNYFSHDSNARNSDKLIRLRMKHKAAGYGVFFMILERLREEPEYMSVKDYNMIAFDLREDASLIKSVIEDFGLFVFTEDGKYFYSESFKRRMEIKDEKSRKRSDAGKKGMANRWCDSNDITNSKDSNNNAITNQDEFITSKEKESKVNNSLPYAQAQEEFLPPDIFDKPLKECYNELASNMSWIEPFVMNIRSAGHKEFTIETFNECLKRFFAKLQNEGEIQKSPKDAMSHFSRWLDIDLKKQEDDKRRAKSFSPTATNPAGKVVRSEAKPATDTQSCGTSQEDYSARF